MANTNSPEPPGANELIEQRDKFATSIAERDPSIAPIHNPAELANQIITTARFHGIPLRNDAGLVSVLAATDIDDSVPKELHGAIAEVLSWIERVDRAARTGQK
ncbi:MAG: hypothetical protein P4L33_10205 [Capsulimonadaceae bacterium]|nr:hypothetical protein [Capsulimonadaceae bacterium]